MRQDGVMSDFFPDPPDAPEGQEDDEPQPVWLNPPDDMLPGIVPVELILGRSDQAVVMLAGMRAFTTGVAMTLLVRTRTRMRRLDLGDEVFDGPYRHDQDDAWRRDRLRWGFEFADGRRATSVDPWPDPVDAQRTPERPVLSGGGGGGGARAVDRDYWLWPLPPPGALTVVLQWPQLGIEQTTSRIDADQIVAAATRAQPIWPSD
jgi:hypothetical protein